MNIISLLFEKIDDDEIEKIDKEWAELFKDYLIFEKGTNGKSPHSIYPFKNSSR